MILPAGNAKVFVDQIFRIFDKDGNGSIDFKVFTVIVGKVEVVSVVLHAGVHDGHGHDGQRVARGEA